MDPRELNIEEFDYPLPDSLIARHPLERRDECRLLVRRHDGTLQERVFCELPGLLPAGSLLVANNTRVINARMVFHKQPGGARIEVFCLEPVSPADYERSFAATDTCSWLCFVGNSRKWKEGSLKRTLSIDGTEVTLTATREDRRGNASVVRFSWSHGVSFSRIVEAAGVIPIPPYLNRETEAADSSDYQTVYSRIEGSVAAPTAGLHFTAPLLERIAAAGIGCRELTLHVGAGTFAPVKSATMGEHPMHSEFISVSRSLIAELAEGSSPVIAVGTTSVRTLESLYHLGCMTAAEGFIPDELPQWYPYGESHPRLSVGEALGALAAALDARGEERLVASTRIIIAPGYEYRIVKGMVTNFHQPKSTLLLLVSAFTGGDWRPMYNHAVANGFRFLSYGDAQLLL